LGESKTTAFMPFTKAVENFLSHFPAGFRQPAYKNGAANERAEIAIEAGVRLVADSWPRCILQRLASFPGGRGVYFWLGVRLARTSLPSRAFRGTQGFSQIA
jgi:hypothetical protein